MINASEYCIFYYNPAYQPVPKKSGTELAFKYANQRKRGGKDLTLINLYR